MHWKSFLDRDRLSFACFSLLAVIAQFLLFILELGTDAKLTCLSVLSARA